MSDRPVQRRARGLSWEEGILRDAVAECKKTWGTGWHLLGDDIRSALVARKVLAVVAQQDTDGMSDAQKARVLANVIELATRAIKEDL